MATTEKNYDLNNGAVYVLMGGPIKIDDLKFHYELIISNDENFEQEGNSKQYIDNRVYFIVEAYIDINTYEKIEEFSFKNLPNKNMFYKQMYKGTTEFMKKHYHNDQLII